MKRGNRLTSLLAHDVAIDLGTANILLATPEQGVIFNEPALAAINTETNQVVALGSEAKQMQGRTPGYIEVIQPLKEGLVSNFEIAEHLIHHYVEQLHNKYRTLWPRPKIIMNLPGRITEVERRAVSEAARSAGARKVYMIDESIAAALGLGVDFETSNSVMTVEIGGGSTEILVVSDGRTVAGASLKIAGDDFTEAITKFIKSEYSLEIGQLTAEKIKHEIGAMLTHQNPKTMEVVGRSLGTGMAKSIVIGSDQIARPLMKQSRPIVDAIKQVLEDIPAELVPDITKAGLILSGGGSRINGFDLLIQQRLKLPVQRAKNPMTATIEGDLKALSNLKTYQKLMLNDGRAV